MERVDIRGPLRTPLWKFDGLRPARTWWEISLPEPSPHKIEPGMGLNRLCASVWRRVDMGRGQGTAQIRSHDATKKRFLSRPLESATRGGSHPPSETEPGEGGEDLRFRLSLACLANLGACIHERWFTLQIRVQYENGVRFTTTRASRDL